MEASELLCKGTINVLGETCSLVRNYDSGMSVCIYRPNRLRIHIPIGLDAIGTSDRLLPDARAINVYRKMCFILQKSLLHFNCLPGHCFICCKKKLIIKNFEFYRFHASFIATLIVRLLHLTILIRYYNYRFMAFFSL